MISNLPLLLIYSIAPALAKPGWFHVVCSLAVWIGAAVGAIAVIRLGGRHLRDYVSTAPEGDSQGDSIGMNETT